MSFLNAAIDVLSRDTGHALNAASNLVNNGTLHAPVGSAPSPGDALINYARSNSSDPGTIVNLAGNNYSAGHTVARAGSGNVGSWGTGANGGVHTGSSPSPSAPANSSQSAAAATSGVNSVTAPLISESRTALQDALDALNASNTTVNAEEAQQENVMNSNKAQQGINYNTSLQQDAQSLADAMQGARTQGNSDLTSLDRMIAAMGGGGSSVEQELIPKLVEQNVAKNISGANATKASNDRSATTAWNTFLNNWGSQLQQLRDQASQQKATNQGAYDRSNQQFSQIINDLLSGTGSPSTEQYELQTDFSQIPNVVNWTPKFSGVTPAYTAPQLSTYEQTPSQVAAQAGASAPTSGAAVIPWLAALGQNAQRQNANTPNTPTTVPTTPVIATS